MYYQNYEDYMRNVLGYSIENQNLYSIKVFGERGNNNTMSYKNTKELEECYPDIYKIINPIVCDVCNKYNNSITRYDVDRMVEEVYQRVMLNNEIIVKTNNDNKSTQREENRTDNVKINANRNINKEPVRQTREMENRQIRSNNNLLLKDLIRILILNKLLGNFLPGRPPHINPPFQTIGNPPFLRKTGEI